MPAFAPRTSPGAAPRRSSGCVLPTLPLVVRSSRSTRRSLLHPHPVSRWYLPISFLPPFGLDRSCPRLFVLCSRRSQFSLLRVSPRSATRARTRATAQCRTSAPATRRSLAAIARCSVVVPIPVPKNRPASGSRVCCRSRPSAQTSLSGPGCSARRVCSHAARTATAEEDTSASTFPWRTRGEPW